MWTAGRARVIIISNSIARSSYVYTNDTVRYTYIIDRRSAADDAILMMDEYRLIDGLYYVMMTGDYAMLLYACI